MTFVVLRGQPGERFSLVIGFLRFGIENIDFSFVFICFLRFCGGGGGRFGVENLDFSFVFIMLAARRKTIMQEFSPVQNAYYSLCV